MSISTLLSALALFSGAAYIDGTIVALVTLFLSTAAAACLAYGHMVAGRRAREHSDREAERALQMSCCGATGALLRRPFLEACEKRIAQAASPLAYVAVDMDHLKTINDSLGHDVGDVALRRLVQCMRAVAGPDAVIGRLGGDEFAFLAPCEGSEDAEAIAAAFQAELKGATTPGNRELALSATLGIVLVPQDTAFLSEALQFSDLALYKGKNEGRSRATRFVASMLYDFRRSHQIERELRLALQRDELCQTYRPVVNREGAVCSARAVLQWTNPWLGVVPAETFVEVAEKTNLIDRLGEWSLRRACFDAMHFRKDIAVSVAVSSQQLKREAVVEMFVRAVADSGIAPERVVAVVSQSSTSSTSPGIESRLGRLRAIGIRISLDDIGAILCDFDRLRRFPVDIVRIPDRQIQRLGSSEADNVAVTALASIGRAMDLLVVAEGVTDDRQLTLARTAGCDRFSGPLFAVETDVEGVNRLLDGPLVGGARAERERCQATVS